MAVAAGAPVPEGLGGAAAAEATGAADAARGGSASYTPSDLEVPVAGGVAVATGADATGTTTGGAVSTAEAAPDLRFRGPTNRRTSIAAATETPIAIPT